MADSRFFHKKETLTLAEIVEITGTEVEEGVDLLKTFSNVQGLAEATQGDVSWLFISAMEKVALTTKAGACIVTENLKSFLPEGCIALISKDAHKSYGLLSQAFYPRQVNGIVHPKAFVDETAVLGEGCQIDAGAFIGKNVKLGKRCHIYPNAVLLDSVEMGDDCTVGSNATVSFCLAGNKVYIYQGTQVGQDGFGFAMNANGPTKVMQLGRVLIGNDVEIGSNTTVDRGAMGDTVIGNGVRIDNLCQIAHNVKIGDNSVIVAQVGIAGSTELGQFVVVAGQAGLAGHIKIGSGSQIGAQSGILGDIPAGSKLMGTPAMDQRDYFKLQVLLRKMLKDRVKRNKTND